MVARDFDLAHRVALVTGGYGVLGGSNPSRLAASGVRVAVWGRRPDACEAKVGEIREAGGIAAAFSVDVLDREQVHTACEAVLGEWDRVDILINAAGGNVARARSDDRSIFEVPLDAFDEVLALNLHGTLIPSLVVGEAMAHRRSGSIVNVSSMASFQALSGVMGYSIAKAGIDNFTRWLAVDLARRYGDGLRVNAVAPGFFITKQNRDVLIDADGTYRERAQKVIARTPMGRFGTAEELYGAVHWLCSDAASFVTGTVIPVDGGFSAYSGV
jgi:NAD(P)-dependent dehydrogenase (short-subunit alcohol dehydrogenase family)